MGLFSKFKDLRQQRDDKKIAKTLAIIKNPKAIKEDRQGAIEYFKDLGDAAAAVPALLQRFEFSLEHGINDTREKEAAMAAVLGYGPEALTFVREHLLNTSRIAWPIKVLKALGEEDQVIAILKSALDFSDVRFDQAKVDKNYDILCYMMDYKLPDFSDKLAHFLVDPDERVRFACAELLIEQDDHRVPGYLEAFIGDESQDHTRIRRSVIEAFLSHRWPLAQPERFPGRQVLNGLYVDDQGRLEVRQ